MTEPTDNPKEVQVTEVQIPQEKLIKRKNKPKKLNNKSKTPIKIDYTEIDRTIKIIKNSKAGFYDPIERAYFLDGFKMSENFLNDTISKFSHYINAVSNMRYNFPVGSYKDYMEAQNLIAKEIKDDEDEEKATRKEFEKDIPVAIDDDGNPITYG